MNKKILLLAVFVLFCSVCIVQSRAKDIKKVAPEGYVKLSIAGTQVNLRPLPQASGNIIKQVNTGDTFIAEQWTIENTAEKSKWYRIVFAVNANGGITPLASTDKKFKAGMFPFVSAQYAKASPVTEKEDAIIRKIPYREGFNYDLGNNLPDIVSKFGLGEIKRTFSPEEIEYFGVGNILFATVSLPGLPKAFLWEGVDGEYYITGKDFTLTKPGFVYDGISIATKGFGKEEVRKLMKAEWKDMQPHIFQLEDGEHWFYSAEMWNCRFVFDKKGLVKSYSYYFTTG